MGPVSLATIAPAAQGNTQHEKVRKAGAQFEAVLLNNVLGAVEQTFTRLPGSPERDSTEAYSGLAMQALTSKLAEGGGIGIGRLLTKALEERSIAASEK
jgi:Rod binding domain-containing protein